MRIKRRRTILNYLIKIGYFKNIDSVVELSYWTQVVSPNEKYRRKVLKQSMPRYEKMLKYVHGF